MHYLKTHNEYIEGISVCVCVCDENHKRFNKYEIQLKQSTAKKYKDTLALAVPEHTVD